MIDLIRERLTNHLLIFFAGSLVSIFGFTLIGILYSGYVRRRSRKPASLRLLLSDVYPREMYAGPTSRMDLVNFLPTHLLVRPLMEVVELIFAVVLGGELATVMSDAFTHFFGGALQLSAPIYVVIALQVILTILGSEFGIYVFHRLEHENPVLWRIHSVHHSAENPNYFATFRDHPLETVGLTFSKMVGVGLFVGVMLYLSGLSLHPQTFFATGLVLLCFNGFYGGHSHSHLPISFGPFLNVLIGGPIMHQIHHSAESHMFNKNYGMTTHLYDWLFGTLYLPRRGEVFRWGLNDDEYGADNPYLTPRDFYLKPVIDILAMSRAGLRDLIQKIF